ncbi:hypothetical protein P43SY_010865 [Pythium insidiosum]|uniref:Ubiquitin-like protease family profile domain-containing protein n=1 Tax=Pythium insidiosum TaxID=114742 RepID=A0AAD5LR76_PYTIN|nr:hypothetical protein P43SY_010865 [Pythium insidiosum]
MKTDEQIDALAAQVSFMAEMSGTQHVFVPVNLNNIHWAGVLIDVTKKTIAMYDSLARQNPAARVGSIASAIQVKLTSFSTVSLNSPLQNDDANCGLFVVMKFWRAVDSTVSKVMTDTALKRRRFEVLHFILTGKAM